MEQFSREARISKWPIFSLLEMNFLQSIKLACVFGSAGNEAILVTSDDEVFSLGANDNSCLGIGDTKSSLLPRKLEQLCKKGYYNYFIFCSYKSIYVSINCKKPLCHTHTHSADVTEFVYGSGPHVIAITSQGELYSWGHNGYGQLGQGVSITIGHGCTPERIQGSLSGVRIVKVACGGHHTLALTQEGQVSTYNRCFGL